MDVKTTFCAASYAKKVPIHDMHHCNVFLQYVTFNQSAFGSVEDIAMVCTIMNITKQN